MFSGSYSLILDSVVESMRYLRGSNLPGDICHRLESSYLRLVNIIDTIATNFSDLAI